VQPIIEEAGVDAELLERAEQRGHELWARDLLEDLEVETVQGNVNLEQLLDELTVEATEILLMSYGWKGNEWRRMTGKPRWRHFVTRKPSPSKGSSASGGSSRSTESDRRS